jgi:asparagine synthase (glutamine-hydrolysing)
MRKHASASGYAFVDGAPDRLLEGDAIAHHLAAQTDVANAAARLDGCFAAVIAREHETVLVTDRYGAIPLYVRTPSTRPLTASTDPWAVVAAGDSPPQLDAIAVVDMLRLGYVAGERTLVEGVRTLSPASVVRIRDDGTVHTHRYWSLRYEADDAPVESFEKRLDVAFDTLGARIDALCDAQQRDAVLMLSGGIDTRLLAALLATRANSRVRCISYGAPDDPDVIAARDVARTVDFPFEHAPITPASLDDAFFDSSVREVGITSRFTCGAGARVAPLGSDDVVLTGHTGFLSSDMAPLNWGVRNRDDLRRMIYARHYSYDRSEPLVAKAVRADYDALKWTSLEETLADYDPTADAMGEMHRWNQDQRQRKLVYMEYRAYGRRAGWMMPLGAHDIVDVFCSLPWQLRLDQAMYKQVTHRLFTGRAEGLARIGRVGGRLEYDQRPYRKYRTIARLQPLSGAVLTRALPAAKRYGRRQRRAAPLRYGPTPLRHWFLTDSRARSALLARIDGIDVDMLKPEGVRAAVLDARSSEWVFQLLLAGALTVQGVADEARSVWNAARRARAAAVS